MERWRNPEESRKRKRKFSWSFCKKESRRERFSRSGLLRANILCPFGKTKIFSVHPKHFSCNHFLLFPEGKQEIFLSFKNILRKRFCRQIFLFVPHILSPKKIPQESRRGRSSSLKPAGKKVRRPPLLGSRQETRTHLQTPF